MDKEKVYNEAVGGDEGFIPASLVSDTYEKDLSKYADQEIEFVITEFNPKRRRIIGDRKQLMVAKRAEMQKELFERIHPGDVVEGTIKNVTDFGAFIDLGGGKGCPFCKGTGWVEILGCGMVDPNVLEANGIDSKVYSGYALGMGIERITNLKYRVNDLRLFSENDTRFLKEFEAAN